MEHNKGRIYWFIGQTTIEKTNLSTRLHKFLKTEKRNWRRDVFYIDETIFQDSSMKNIHDFASYLHENGCDVVVSLVSPNLETRNLLKDKIGELLTEIYVHKQDKTEHDISNFESPVSNFIDIDVTKHSTNTSFSTLITNLHKLNRL